MTDPSLQILSIGSSCINRFQFEFFVKRQPDTAPAFPRGLFDWNISSLEATIVILRLAAEGKLSAALYDTHALSLKYDTLLFNAHLPGFTFFHEDTPAEILANPERRTAFLSKLDHLAKPFTAPQPDRRTHLVWSNLQPNLPDAVENVILWDDFVLTQDRYDTVRALGRQILGDATSFSFLTHPADVEAGLDRHDDVHIVDLPRGEAYEGDQLLYDPLLTNLTHPPV